MKQQYINLPFKLGTTTTVAIGAQISAHGKNDLLSWFTANPTI
jgi:hypothetical protein